MAGLRAREQHAPLGTAARSRKRQRINPNGASIACMHAEHDVHTTIQVTRDARCAMRGATEESNAYRKSAFSRARSRADRGRRVVRCATQRCARRRRRWI